VSDVTKFDLFSLPYENPQIVLLADLNERVCCNLKLKRVSVSWWGFNSKIKCYW